MMCSWEVRFLTSNETYEQVHASMSALGLTTAESILDNWVGMATEQNLPIIDVLNHLFTQEISSRRESAIRTRTKLSGFPVKKSLDDFEFEFQASIDKKVVNDLRTLRFVNNAENLILLGPSGVGKTHIAIGLGMDAIKAGFSVYFINSAIMIEKLKVASQRGNLERKLKTLNKYKLLIVDEIGYLPFDTEASNLFFRLISKRYEHASTIFTSNKSYSEWGEIFGDPVIATAILDRVLHHSITMNIKGESYRLKSRKKSGLFPTYG
jgi:DNA replication protein DnaC